MTLTSNQTVAQSYCALSSIGEAAIVKDQVDAAYTLSRDIIKQVIAGDGVGHGNGSQDTEDI